MKILILGAGHMGAWLVEEFCLDYDVAVFDIEKRKLKYFFNVHRLFELSETREFEPDIVINAVSLNHTKQAFDEVLPYIGESCIPGGTNRNYASYGHHIQPVSDTQKAILCDPQTSGGLLIAVDPDRQEEVISLLQSRQIQPMKRRSGHMTLSP